MSEWLTPAEAGAILGVGPDRVAQLARDGTLTSMRTPGNHVRVRREEVEALAEGGEDDPPPAPARRRADTPDDAPKEPTPRPRPKWEDVPPWQRRVREAEADVDVLRLDSERERLIEDRERRESERDQAETRRVVREADAQRLRDLKTFALECLPFDVPDDVKARVARELEELVTVDAYPSSLGQAYVETLLRGEVERLLRSWRARQARQARVQKDASERRRLIEWAALHVVGRVPRQWDWEARREFERELKKVLEDEVEAGMDQDEANAIGLEFLDEWREDEEQD